MCWKTVVENYTKRELTFPQDKLIAMAGIATELDRKMRQSKPSGVGSSLYIAGMWNIPTFIEYELSWFQLSGIKDVFPGAARAKEYRAPSWSWASVTNPVIYQDRSTAEDV
jgi:hypothetical protein